MQIAEEKFIPFLRHELIDVLSYKIGNSSKEFIKFCDAVDNYYHNNFYKISDKLKNIYSPFDPDIDIRLLKKYSNNELSKNENDILNEIRYLLNAGNYNEITKDELINAFSKESPWGLKLKVNFEEYEWFYMYSKGKYPDKRIKKILLYKKQYDFDVYSRVILIFKLKDNGKVRKDNLLYNKIYMKNFKNVPTVDLEMLFPNIKILIRTFDKLTIIIPLIAGVATTIFNIVKYLISQGKDINPFFQMTFLGLIGGFFGLALRSFFDYKNTLEHYLKNLTASLYMQNLDNNLGVLESLLDNAREEELKEIILGYYFLITDKNKKIDAALLDKKIEDFFNKNLNKGINFDINDSIRKLKDLKVLIEKNKILKALPIKKAISVIIKNTNRGSIK